MRLSVCLQSFGHEETRDCGARTWCAWAVFVLGGFGLIALTSGAVFAASGDSAAVKRGEYVFRVAGCKGCHTEADGKGPALAGGHRFDTPFGVFYSPNITSHKTAGIGAWTQAQFITALTRGLGPGNKHYYPVFPFPSYTSMKRADLSDLYAYLMGLPAIARANREHQLPWYFRWRIGNWAWKFLFLEEGEWQDNSARSKRWNRGAYIAKSLAHCAQCHTARNVLGALVHDQHLGGNEEGPDGDSIPNITSAKEAGIGSWSGAEIADYLSTGEDPDTDFAGGLMAEVIEQGTSQLTAEDLASLVEYLQSVPPVGGSSLNP